MDFLTSEYGVSEDVLSKERAEELELLDMIDKKTKEIRKDLNLPIKE